MVNAAISLGAIKISVSTYITKKAVVPQGLLYGMFCNNCNFQRLLLECSVFFKK